MSKSDPRDIHRYATALRMRLAWASDVQGRWLRDWPKWVRQYEPSREFRRVIEMREAQR